MYLLTYNAESNEIHAGLGGVITRSEGQVLIEELVDLMDQNHSGQLVVELDTSRVSRYSEGAIEEIERFRFVCAQKDVTLIAITQDQNDGEMSPNVRAILEGQSSELFEQRLAA